MKKIGLVGGMGPESTVEYYQGIINAFKVESEELNYPDIIIYSVNLSKVLGLMRASDNQGAMSYLFEKLKKLEVAGADFVAMTANTPHLFFNELAETINVPMLSIVEATAREARRFDLRRPGLLGTGFTMNNTFFADVFRKLGMEIVVPEKSAKEYIDTKLFSEIELGIFKEETREGLLQIVKNMKQSNDIDGIIMGCTELPLILPENSYHGLPVLNTTEIHIREIVERCRS
jgi:aspartate racemase